MLRLEKIDGRNVWEILELRVSEEQKAYVADNKTSLIEAYVALAGNGHAFPFGIYEEDTPVGFLMIGFDREEGWVDAPSVAEGNYSLWRLMIDQRYQKRGYGKEALRLAMQFIQTQPCGKAEYCWLSYAPENLAAHRLYHEMGFVPTGEMDGEECIAVLKLQM